MAVPDLQSLLLAEMDAVYRLAYHLVSRPQDADDFVQETFLRAFKAADRFELNEYGPRPWLFKILHNVIASRYKAVHRNNQLLGGLTATDESSEPLDRLEIPINCLADLHWDDVDEQLKQSIDELPLLSRMTFLLHAVEGLKYKEIATVTGVPIGTVMSRLSRARQVLATQLRGYAHERGWIRCSPTAPPFPATGRQPRDEAQTSRHDAVPPTTIGGGSEAP